jgi:methionyl aminopeptidase
MNMTYVRALEAPRGRTEQIKLYDPATAFPGMHAAGRLAAACLDMIAGEVREGVSTGRLDDLARQFIYDHGALPACLGYRGYRHTLCISLNHVVCHGIPGARTLKPGDMMNIDVTVIVEGWHGDTSRMYAIGEISRKAERLMDVTYEAMMRGIAAIKPGARLGDLGRAIQAYAESERCSVVREFCGHGVGRVFHDAPNILHYGKSGEGEELRPGMMFTVEPMLNAGAPDTKILGDGWTAVTKDKSYSAQYEHSVGVSETGVEIFTCSPAGLDTPHKSAG